MGTGTSVTEDDPRGFRENMKIIHLGIPVACDLLELDKVLILFK